MKKNTKTNCVNALENLKNITIDEVTFDIKCLSPHYTIA